MDTLVHALNGLLMIAIPLALGLVLARRLRVGWGVFGVGALTFIASQVLHLPFNRYVLAAVIDRLGLAGAQQGLPLAMVALLVGLSAGVFEEGARYLVYGFWVKKGRSWRQALMFGAGHGGVEAILLGVLATYGFLQAMAVRNVDLATLVPAENVEAARAQVAAYWAMPWYDALMGAFERVSALCLQVGMAVMVLQVFTRHNPLWLVAAVLWHALADAVAVFAMPTWGVYVTEGLVALLALATVGAILALRSPEPPEPETTIGALPPVTEFAPAAGVPQSTPDRLEDSRYDH